MSDDVEARPWKWAAINPTGGAEIGWYEYRRLVADGKGGHKFEVARTLNCWEMASEANTLQAQADLVAGLRAWKDAVEDAAVGYWTLNGENANDPRKAVADLIAIVQRMDFDPAISEVAAKAELLDEYVAQLISRCPACVDGFVRNYSEGRNGWGHEGTPIPMILYCPICCYQHLDEEEWATRPHKTHQCQHCSHEWRPANVATVGVAELQPHHEGGEG